MVWLKLVVISAISVFGCEEWMRGDGNCDRACIAPIPISQQNLEISDCASSCDVHCSSAQKQSTICEDSCKTWDCGWASCDECAPGCSVSMLANDLCDATCDVEECGFDYGDCKHTLETFVASQGGKGVGTLSNPYSELGNALDSLWYPNNTISLLNGIHLLNRLNSIQFPLLSQNGLSTTLIQPLMCSNTTSDDSRCVNYRATIRITRYFAFFNLNHSVTFSNVDFRGDFDIKEGCFTPECIYCPYLSYDSRNSSWITDQNKIIDISQAAEQTLCDIYHDKSIIIISKSGKLTLNNVSFVYFRQQLQSLIEIDCGDLEMESVDFVNNMAAPTGLWGGLIQLRSPPEAYPYYCGSITFSKGTVSLLNNGYEYRSDIVSSGFLSLDGVYLLNISYVDFSFNFIAIGDNVTLMSSALISLNKFRQVSISDCTFEYNLAGLSSMLYVDSYLTLPLTNVNGVAGEHALVHMSISNCTFIKNASQRGGTFQVNFHLDHQNVHLSNLTFIENFALLGAVLIFNEGLEDDAAFGHHYLLDGQDVFSPPRGVVIEQIEIRDSLSENAFVCSNIGNLGLHQLKMIRNGQSRTGVTSFAYVLLEFSLNLDCYSVLIPNVSMNIDCNGIASVSNILNLTLSDSVFSENYCPNGVPGILLSGRTKDILVQSNNFTHNTGSGVVTLSVQRPIEISHMLCYNNTSLHSKTSVCFNINMQTASDVVISDSQFLYNSGLFVTVLFAGNTKSLSLRRVSFVGNTARFTSGGVWFNPKVDGPSSLTIEDSLFSSNYASKNGVVTISDYDEVLSDNDVAIVRLSVRRCTFTNNTSAFRGAAITINDYIKLTTDSEVADCKFVNNTSVAGSSGYFTFQYGVLKIDGSLFEGNAGNDGSALFLNHFPTYSANISAINITNCVFRYQIQGPAVSITGYDIGNDVYAYGNLFYSNYVGAYVITGGNLVDRDSVYTLQTANEGPVLYIQLVCLVKAYNQTAYNNRSTRQHGGVYYLTTHSYFGLFDSNVYNNSAADSGGVVWVDENSAFEIANSSLHDNTAETMGSVFYIFPGTLIVRDCVIFNNFAKKYASVSIVRSVGTISNTTFFNNTSLVDSPGIVLSGSTLTLNDSVFSDQTGLTGPFLFSIDHSTSYISRSHFVRGHATFQGGAFHLAMDSEVNLVDSVFKDCVSDVEGGAILASGSYLSIRSSTFLQSSSKTLGGVLHCSSGSVSISDTLFQTYFPSAVYLNSMSTSEIARSTFLDGVGEQGGAIACLQSDTLRLVNNSLTNNRANYGGAAYLSSSGRAGDSMRVEITGNSFSNNTGISAGAVYLESTNATIEYNHFLSNSAVDKRGKEGVGGALLLSCELTDLCDVTITGNEFDGNKASLQGGGLAWSGTLPGLKANIWGNNSAAYGSDIASFPVKLAPASETGSLLPYVSDTASVPVAIVITKVGSGQMIHTSIKLGLFDHESKLITNDFRSSAQMYVSDNLSLSLSGNAKATAAGGIISFNDFAVTGVPGTTQYLIVETNAVDTERETKARDGLIYFDRVKVQVELRKCEIGESQLDNTCFVCSSGTYSLDPTLPCKLCPDAAICYGNYTMVPKEGFWRANNETDQFIKCLADEACVGSPDQTFLSLTGLCNNGYSGNLCQICLTGFSRTGRYQCAKCPGLTPNIAITTLIVLVALSFVALIVFTAIRGASRPRSLIAIYIKIFMNYLQMIVVSSSLNLNWPSFVKTFLNGQEAAGGFAEQLFSFECLFQDIRVGQGSMYFTKVIGISFLPVVLFILGVIAWISILCCFKLTDFWLKLKASLVVILFILHPTITKTMFSYFACMDLGLGEMWLINDLSIKCWDSAHLKQIFTVILPSICVWIIGLPCISLLYLIANRKILESWHIKQVFSFLYKGYESPYFYWEFVILYRKVALVSASVFLNTVNIRVQALTILALLLVSLFLQIQIKPFNEVSLNRLEVRSILVSAITIYAGFFLNILIFVGMLLANAYFLTHWLRAVSPILLTVIRERLRSLWNLHKRNYRVRPTTMGIGPQISSEKIQSSSISHSDLGLVDGSHSQGDVSDPPNTSFAQSPDPTPEREYTDQENREVHYTFEEEIP